MDTGWPHRRILYSSLTGHRLTEILSRNLLLSETLLLLRLAVILPPIGQFFPPAVQLMFRLETTYASTRT